MEDLVAVDLALARPWLSFSLPPELEAGYEAATRSGRRKGIRLYLATILVVVLAFTPFDLWADVAWQGVALRFGLLVPLVLVSLWVLRKDRAIALEGGLGIACVLAIVGCITVLALLTEPPYTEGYLMGAGMIGFAGNLSMPLRVRHAVMLYVGDVSVYCGLAMSGILPRHFAQTPELALFFSIAILATLRYAISRERGSKNLYLLQLRDQARTRELAHLVEELTRVADRDALTEIGNRRYFDKAFDRAWGDAVMEGGSLALAMIDVDHFKTFNDRAGHAEGDRCLRAVARALASAARPIDALPARYGGEEFAVLMPIRRLQGFEGPEVLALAERLRGAVEGLAISHPAAASRAAVTVSVGVALAAPGRDAYAPETLLVAADRALYEAKRAGRNRVALAPASPLDAAA